MNFNLMLFSSVVFNIIEYNQLVVCAIATWYFFQDWDISSRNETYVHFTQEFAILSIVWQGLKNKHIYHTKLSKWVLFKYTYMLFSLELHACIFKKITRTSKYRLKLYTYLRSITYFLSIPFCWLGDIFQFTGTCIKFRVKSFITQKSSVLYNQLSQGIVVNDDSVMRYLKREHSSYDLEMFCLIVRILCVLPGKYFFYIKMFYKCMELKRPYSCVIFRVWSQEYLTIWICNNNASSSVYLVMLASGRQQLYNKVVYGICRY